jgi:hypothetical protein
MRTRALPSAAFCFLCTLIVAPCLAEESKESGTLQLAIQDLSSQIKSFMDAEGIKTVSVQKFTGSTENETGGLAIQRMIMNGLGEDRVDNKSREYTLKGDYFGTFPKNQLGMITIQAKLQSVEMGEIRRFPKYVDSQVITSAADIDRLLGLNVSRVDKVGERTNNANPAGGPDATALVKKNTAQIEATRKAILEPSFELSGSDKTRFKPSKDAKFELEILVRSAGTSEFLPRRIVDKEGTPFIEGLAEGDAYQVRIYNNSGFPVGMKLFLDGINALEFSQPEIKAHGTYLVRSNIGTIKGWLVNGSGTEAFLLTRQQRADFPPAGEIGTITAQFFHAWPKNEQAPDLEQAFAGRGELQTTRGDLIPGETKLSTEMFFGKAVLATLSLRYTFPSDLPPIN